jgi:hypothetical protein
MSVSLTTLKRSLLSAGALAMTALPGLALADSQPASTPAQAASSTTMGAKADTKTTENKAADTKTSASTKTTPDQTASVPAPSAPTTKMSDHKSMPASGPTSGTEKPATTTDTSSKL